MKLIQSFNRRKIRLQVFIPSQYEAIALLSELITSCKVNLEILTAVWQSDSLNGNWLKLALQGNSNQLLEAITYFQRAGVLLKIVPEINSAQLGQEPESESKAIALEIEPLEKFCLAS
ncbi:MAG TPA: hypothetical protein ACFCUY_16465 [Xenococcaceae cyanobacterium]